MKLTGAATGFARYEGLAGGPGSLSLSFGHRRRIGVVMLRALRVTASGWVLGLLIGILGPVIGVAANVWDDRRRMSDTTDEPPYLSEVWSTLTNRRALPYWALLTGMGAANGMIGALAAWRGYFRMIPVLILPLLLFLFPLISFAENPSDLGARSIELFVVVFFGLFVLVAGRVGQELGARQRPAEPVAAPDPARRLGS
jgi:hypothetical protein